MLPLDRTLAPARLLTPDEAIAAMPRLAELMHACVHDGASVGFVLPFSRADSAGWWRTSVMPALERGDRVLCVVERDHRIVATGQLIVAMLPNQRHRGEISKVLVDPAFRRQGLGAQVMSALEAEARARGKTILTLDTRTGDAGEPLYARAGFRVAGTIPGYCRHPSEDKMESTTYMFKHLD